MNRVYVVTPRQQTTREIIDALLWGCDAAAYVEAIERQGAEATARQDMEAWVDVLPIPWAHGREGDAQLELLSEPEGAGVVEVTLGDILAYYRDRGWMA